MHSGSDESGNASPSAAALSTRVLYWPQDLHLASAEPQSSMRSREVTKSQPEQPDDIEARYSAQQLRVVLLDVTTQTAVVRAFAGVRTAFGRIDVLNNAAFRMLSEADGASEEDARLPFETNLWGVVNVQ